MDEMTFHANPVTRSPETDSDRLPARVDRTRRRLILAEAVRSDVIPGLLARRSVPTRPAIADSQIVALAELTLHGGGSEAVAFVTAMLRDGHAAEALYLDLLSPAAALLGQYWVDDVCNFADVTIGLVHLQQAMRALEQAFFAGAALAGPSGPRAMLLPLPGEQHTFGLGMLADFFRRAGWHTWSGTVADSAALRAAVAGEWVDVVGFSLACDEMLDPVRREIASVRAASRNRAVVVMVGGPPFVADESLARRVGADGTAKDGLQAVAAAERLLPRRVKERGRGAAS